MISKMTKAVQASELISILQSYSKQIRLKLAYNSLLVLQESHHDQYADQTIINLCNFNASKCMKNDNRQVILHYPINMYIISNYVQKYLNAMGRAEYIQYN